jgi:hypothetical protein
MGKIKILTLNQIESMKNKNKTKPVQIACAEECKYNGSKDPYQTSIPNE